MSDAIQNNWRKWRAGFAVATVIAFLGGFIASSVAPEITSNHLYLLIVVNAAKDIVLWLKNHPIEDVVD